MFEEFWKAYPIKKAKKNARKIWDKEGLDSMSQQIIDHIAMMLEKDKLWSIGFGIPHPSTYLNQERWDDEPEIEQPQEQRARLPRDDNQLMQFAQSHGLMQPGSGQSFFEYRRKLEREIDNRRLN